MTQGSPIPVGRHVDIAPVAGAPQRVHFHDMGVGQVVIFLHGAGGGASGYSNFKGNYAEFARAGYRCIVPDMLGFGLSSKPDIPMYDLDFFVAGVKGLVDAASRSSTPISRCPASPTCSPSTRPARPAPRRCAR